MIILGIDPGTAITGFGIIKSEGNRIMPVKYGVIRTDSSYDLTTRLHKIYENITLLAKEYKPAEAAVEQLFFNKNAKTALSVGHARGVVLLAAFKAGLEVSEYTPLQVKQAVVGYGRADKMQVQKMVKSILGLQDIPKPDDAADALAIAICHAHSRNINKVLANR
ncbi:MAG: crossover junction endodeoxyribonuclease RuvC [Clostridia bacterium]|jgi:crossover junction endodeoxyribonuclease RuvC|nr:crossover junction endodeoxyribonuclease RuvC [Clostridiales bacterium]MDK2986291.1 crossover junction endodeoxyribonuclease RuvC [Clostridia bacterium]